MEVEPNWLCRAAGVGLCLANYLSRASSKLMLSCMRPKKSAFSRSNRVYAVISFIFVRISGSWVFRKLVKRSDCLTSRSSFSRWVICSSFSSSWLGDYEKRLRWPMLFMISS